MSSRQPSLLYLSLPSMPGSRVFGVIVQIGGNRMMLEGAGKMLLLYSCFEKGCPTKPYATIPKGIMGNGGLWYLIEALGVLAT